jgi:hypothetical protein
LLFIIKPINNKPQPSTNVSFTSSFRAFFAGFARILRIRGKPAQPRSPDICRVHLVSRALDDQGFNILEFPF